MKYSFTRALVNTGFGEMHLYMGFGGMLVVTGFGELFLFPGFSDMFLYTGFVEIRDFMKCSYTIFCHMCLLYTGLV